MKLSEIINENLIILDIKSDTKKEILSEMVELFLKAGYITDKDRYLNSIIEREKLGTTGIGKGIAIPHGKTEDVKKVSICFARSKKGVDFESLDGKPVHLIFMLAAPINSDGDYLKALAKLSRLLRYKEFKDKLVQVKNGTDIIDIIKEQEND